MELSKLEKEKDIAIVGYYYSGVDLLYNIILQLTGYGSLVPSASHVKNIVCSEGETPTPYPDSLSHTTRTIVFIVRNPKDIAVTMYKHQGAGSSTEFSDFLYNFFFGESGEKWCEHTKQWEGVLSKLSPSTVHLVYFDDLIKSFEAEVFRLSQFLNICKSFEQISDLCSVLSGEADQPQHKRRKTESNENSYTEALYAVGEWKNHFTVHLQEQFDIAIVNVLKDLKLDIPKLLWHHKQI